MTSARPDDEETAAAVGQVASIWQRALNVGRPLTAEAGFLSLGGDSLILMSIMAEVEDRFGVELDVDAVVADLTVGGMARAALAAKARAGSDAH
jgi:acyl carrier protein